MRLPARPSSEDLEWVELQLQQRAREALTGSVLFDLGGFRLIDVADAVVDGAFIAAHDYAGFDILTGEPTQPMQLTRGQKQIVCQSAPLTRLVSPEQRADIDRLIVERVDVLALLQKDAESLVDRARRDIAVAGRRCRARHSIRPPYSWHIVASVPRTHIVREAYSLRYFSTMMIGGIIVNH